MAVAVQQPRQILQNSHQVLPSSQGLKHLSRHLLPHTCVNRKPGWTKRTWGSKQSSDLGCRNPQWHLHQPHSHTCHFIFYFLKMTACVFSCVFKKEVPRWTVSGQTNSCTYLYGGASQERSNCCLLLVCGYVTGIENWLVHLFVKIFDDYLVGCMKVTIHRTLKQGPDVTCTQNRVLM